MSGSEAQAHPVHDTTWVSALRRSFVEHGYAVDAVVEAIGEDGQQALGRNSTVLATRALAGRHDPLATLTMLWPLQRSVAREDLERALPGQIAALEAAEIIETSGGEVRALVDIRPYASDDGASGWIMSDLSPGLDTRAAPIRPDFVLGVSPASTSLAQLTMRGQVDRALDLGTGCGVQSLHLARHARQVVATDLNPRAIEHARITFALNEVEVDLRTGSFYEPVAGELFDLIATNPPYVMSPPRTDADRLTYREGTWRGDGLVEHVVRSGADHLADDGVLQVLGNWAHPADGDWTERLASWIPAGFNAHIVQREALDPAEYVELWLADAGLAGSPGYLDRYAEWLDYLADAGVAGIGMGWLVLHKAGQADPTIRIEEWPYAVEQPIGPAFEAEIEAIEVLGDLTATQVLERSWALAEDIIEETHGQPGAADPHHIVLRQQRGFRRAVEADTALAGILGACDGELTLGQIISSIAGLLEVDPVALAAEVVPKVRLLAADGILT